MTNLIYLKGLLPIKLSEKEESIPSAKKWRFLLLTSVIIEVVHFSFSLLWFIWGHLILALFSFYVIFPSKSPRPSEGSINPSED